MVVWSAFRSAITRVTPNLSVGARRCMSEHRTFPMTPSRYQWKKFKDTFHFYASLGLIPAGLIILYSNIFVGPATLQEIPEDYVPKHWEYYRHPISRFIARYILNSPQQDYEKYLHFIFEEDEKKRMRKLTTEIENKIKERGDYQAYYYRPVLGKYHRVSKEAASYLESIRGDD